MYNKIARVSVIYSATVSGDIGTNFIYDRVTLMSKMILIMSKVRHENA